MHYPTAQRLIQELIKERKTSDKHVVTDRENGRDYLVSVEILPPGHLIRETRSTLNPSGTACTCCGGSGRA